LRLIEASSKELLARYGLASPAGRLCQSAEDARAAADEIGCPVFVKAQIPYGDRASLGLVGRVDDPDAAVALARGLIGRAVEGITVSSVLVEAAVEPVRSLYLSVHVDGEVGARVLSVGLGGGAGYRPDSAEIRVQVPGRGFETYEIRRLLGEVGLAGAEREAITRAARLTEAPIRLRGAPATPLTIASPAASPRCAWRLADRPPCPLLSVIVFTGQLTCTRIGCKVPTKQGTGAGAMSAATEKFGAFIRREREAKEIGLREMAKKVGVSPTYMSKVERDEFAPPAEDKVKAIAQIIGCDVDELLARAGRVASDLSDIIKRHPVELAALLRTTKGLTTEDIARLSRDAQKAKDK